MEINISQANKIIIYTFTNVLCQVKCFSNSSKNKHISCYLKAMSDVTMSTCLFILKFNVS